MNGQDFLRVVHQAFVPFLRELGFVMDAPSISGRFYRASFTRPGHSVSVSYEPGDDAIFVFVFCQENGRLSDIDDRLKTPRLSDLNARYMSSVGIDERTANEAAFESVDVRDDAEKCLLKAARELRLVLPRYLASDPA
jgi:hypothetical protein